MLNLRLNRCQCTANPRMLAAVVAVHTRGLRPATTWLLGGSSGGLLQGTAAGMPSAAGLCATYLPALQTTLGVLLPCAYVYRLERGLRGCRAGWGRGGWCRGNRRSITQVQPCLTFCLIRLASLTPTSAASWASGSQPKPPTYCTVTGILPASHPHSIPPTPGSRFLAQRGAQLEPVAVRRELGLALLAVALQLGAIVTLEAG